jgi:hypothetical protein
MDRLEAPISEGARGINMNNDLTESLKRVALDMGVEKIRIASP